MSQNILNELISQMAKLIHPSMEITTVSGNVFNGQLLNLVDNKYLHMRNLKLIKSDMLITPEFVAETLVNTEKIKKVMFIVFYELINR